MKKCEDIKDFILSFFVWMKKKKWRDKKNEIE